VGPGPERISERGRRLSAAQFLGPALADAITGIYAVQGILAALVQRGRTGVGRHVEVSMLEAMTHLAVEPLPRTSRWADTDSADRPRLAQPTLLRRWMKSLLAISPVSAREVLGTGWSSAGSAGAGGGSEIQSARNRRIAEYENIAGGANKRFALKPLAPLDGAFAGAGCAACAVNRVDDVVNDPHVAHLGIMGTGRISATATRGGAPTCAV